MNTKIKKSLGLPREARQKRAKWGQHFLRDPKILKKIVDFARIEPGDTVVEIGPGEGTLTAILLERAEKVIAVEKDEKLANKLKDLKMETSLPDGQGLEIINEDILNFKFKILNFKLVGNIPYYITGAIFEKFLQSDNQPKSITFVVQKEVADRIMSKKGSVLSISIKAFGEPEYGGIIKAGSFYPKPKVNSAIIAIRDITPLAPLTLRREENKKQFRKRFFEILKKGFAHKRKLLIKNLGVPKTVFDRCGIPEKARAEDLKVEDWIALTRNTK